jgi:hypothetical protein
MLRPGSDPYRNGGDRGTLGGMGRVAWAVLVVTVAVAAGCDDDGGAAPDAGSGLYALEVLDPPGDSIGLPFAGAETLRVKYLDDGGRPIADAAVGFELVAGATETTAGSTLSASSALTDDGGVARIELRAGSDRARFRVRVTAPGAGPVLFYVAVSDEGFAALEVFPEHRGFRPLTAFAGLELRLYPTAELSCGGFDPDAPAESVLPPRSLPGFGGAAVFPAVMAGDPLTVVVWGVAAQGGRALSLGCAELPGSALPAGQVVVLGLPVDDRLPALPAALAIRSRFDASPLAAATAPTPDPWRVLACPLGAAQLLLDCALDAAAPDDTLDCAPTGTSALVADLAAARGALDAAGCRGSTIAAGPSLEARLTAATGAPWAGEPLRALVAARAAAVTGFELGSRLTLTGEVAGHRLEDAAIEHDGERHEVDLLASLRPVLEADGVAATIDLGVLAVSPHGFTLRHGELARGAFTALGLEPAGLGARGEALGDAMADAVTAGATGGCPAVSQLTCEAVGRLADCLAAACAAAVPALDDRLAVWLDALDATGLDFLLSGSAVVVDDDLDLVAEGFTGVWHAALSLRGGGEVALAGDLDAVAD